MADPQSGYTRFVEPGNLVTEAGSERQEVAMRLPQMPAYHLVRPDASGITMINIGVGP